MGLGAMLGGVGRGLGRMKRSIGRGENDLLEGNATRDALGAAAANMAGGLALGAGLGAGFESFINSDRGYEEFERALEEEQQKAGRRFTPQEAKEFYLSVGVGEEVANRLLERQAARMSRRAQ
jgi:hypothetical protein